jgi:hypothetical protein
VYDAAVGARATKLGWLLVVLTVVGTAATALRDPPYWDSWVYVNQGRYAAAHGLDVDAWRHPPDVVKPPVFASLLLGLAARAGATPVAMHVVVLLLALALMAGTRELTLALGGDAAAALLAAALCATAPLFAAQVGLVQSDLPAAALATWAWVALVRERIAAWLVLAALAVLTKESAYFLCAPAAVLVWLRAGRSVAATLRRVWIAAWPGVVLIAWMLALRALTGSAVPKLNRDALGAHFVVDTLIHEFIEGRWLVAAFALAAVLRDKGAAVRATAVGVAALPFMFPAPLPRYMMPGLPLLCALAALAITRYVPRQRRALAAGCLLAVNVAGWLGKSWHDNGGHHLDCNLQYRRVLAAQRAAVAAVAAEHPARAIAAFPLYFALRDAGIAPVLADATTPTSALCAAPWFVDADQSAPVDDARVRLAPSLRPWRSFGAPGFSVRVSRIDCAAAAPTRTPPAPPPSTD